MIDLPKILPLKFYTDVAIFAAELALPVFESKYPEDVRPRAAIEAARARLKDPSVDSLHASIDAANAAAIAIAIADDDDDAVAVAAAAAAASASAAVVTAAIAATHNKAIIFYANEAINCAIEANPDFEPLIENHINTIRLLTSPSALAVTGTKKECKQQYTMHVDGFLIKIITEDNNPYFTFQAKDEVTGVDLEIISEKENPTESEITQLLLNDAVQKLSILIQHYDLKEAQATALEQEILSLKKEREND